MVPSRLWIPALAFLVSPSAVAAGDYVGLLRPSAAAPAIAVPEPGFYWPRQGVLDAALLPREGAEAFKLKLGYRHSRYLAVETGYADAGPDASRPFFASAPARHRGFSLDTVGTVPLWSRASLYGRLGAWRSEGGASLLAGVEGSQKPGAGLRYGLGFKIDFTRQIRLRAEMERFSPLDRWGPREADTDQVSVGVTWRF